MPYLLDYLENQFATFEEQPLNAVDAAVLSQMCMVNGKGMIPGLKDRSSFVNVFIFLQDKFSPSNKPVRFIELLQAENFRDMFTGLDPARIKNCLFATASSPRFRNMVVRDYINLFDAERELQFAAMTFVQNDDFAVVTFRGTDSSITGWKEDFNMAYSAPVPAQEQALQYLEAVAGNLPEKIYLCGHSKGGNLAEYAALKVSPEIQQRIERVFILDGPGFKEGFFGSSQYAPIIDRMYKVVPQDSIIGILLDSPVPLHVVPSNAKGFNQHSVFTWEIALKPIELEAELEVEDETEDKLAFLDRIRSREEGESISKAILEELAEGDDLIDYEGVMGCDFVYLEEISDNSSFVSETLRRWLGRYDDKEREGVIDALFRMLEATGADDVLDILSGGAKTLNMFADAASVATDEDKDLIIEAGKDFAETASGLAAVRMGKAAAQGVKAGVAQLKEAAQAAAEKRRLAKELQAQELRIKELQAAEPIDEA
ncbi:MAG: DUF2974 domain-containing protein [Eggerthellaceae bacterium]|nr:DUF2974 domain-containing protein [Eggerthellaceae bacterium]